MEVRDGRMKKPHPKEKWERNQEIIRLVYEENLTYTQIGKRMGITKHRVYIILNREMDRQLIDRIEGLQ